MRIARRTRRMAAGGVAVFFLAFVGMLATAGPLFPWSPVHPGYTTVRFGRASLIQPKGDAVDVGHPDTLLAQLERRTGLRFRSPVTIIVTDDWGRSTGAGCCAPGPGPSRCKVRRCRRER